MPHEDLPGSARDWIRNAKSDLALASLPLEPPILPEALCFHAQQAAEKALKAVLIHRGMEPARTHSIALLVDIVAAVSNVPEFVRAAASLSDYAVSTRYPGLYEPITDRERHEAVQMARHELAWAEEQVD